MKDSRLVQRLNRPRSFDNPFSFGGGMKNGGLSDDAMDLIRGIWSFDYMGAAEFEFGAVPEALRRIARGPLAAFSFDVALADVPANWRDKTKAAAEGTATIYVLCPESDAAEVETRIREWTRVEFPSLKEGLRLTGALRPVEERDSDVCGWLELNNGFLFFTDREMWEKACALFNVSVADAEAVTT